MNLRFLKTEGGAFLTLGLPLALSQAGWMLMRVVDTYMVGNLGPTAIAATSLGAALAFVFMVFGFGTIVGGLEPAISQAVGASRQELANAFFFHGFRLALIWGVALSLLLLPIPFFLERVGYDQELSQLTRPYMILTIAGVVPYLGYGVCRAFLQSHGIGSPPLVAVAVGNIIHVFLNYGLIFGKFGLPRWGVTGSGVSTLVIRFIIFFYLLIWIFRNNRLKGWNLQRSQMHHRSILDRKILSVGWPAGSHLTMEIGCYVGIAAIIGLIGSVPLAAHHIAMNWLSITFMIPLGISMAASARVGNARGAGNTQAIRDAGWAATIFGGSFMLMMALIFWTIPDSLVSLFTDDPKVIALGTSMLIVGGISHTMDGIQVVLTGALRGLSDTRFAFIVNAFGYWVIGLPIGLCLCFVLGFGAVGFWWGFCLALLAIGGAMLARWSYLSTSRNG